MSIVFIKRALSSALFVAPLLVFFQFVLSQSASADPLRELISKSLQSHPIVSAHEYRIESGEANVKTARWQFYPTLGLALSTDNRESSISERSFSDSFDSFGEVNTSIVSLEQPLWTGGRLTGELDRADALLRDTEEGLGQVHRDLALRVVQAYGDWYAAKLRTGGWQESLLTHVRLTELVAHRFEEGLSSDSDRLLADSRLDSVIANLGAAKAQEQVALSVLSQLTGTVIKLEGSPLSLTLPVILDDLPKLLEHSIEQSPSILQALAQVDVAQADVSIQKSSRVPEVFLRVEHEFGNSGLMARSFSDSTIFIGVRTAFGAGLSVFSSADSSHAIYQASLDTVNIQKRAVREQVQGDYFLKSSFAAQLEALIRAAATTEEVFASYNRQFLAGRKTWFDLLNSARDLAQSKIQLSDAEAAHLVVTWRLAIFTQSLNELLDSEYKTGIETSHLSSSSTMSIANDEASQLEENLEIAESAVPLEDTSNNSPSSNSMFNEVHLVDFLQAWLSSWQTQDLEEYFSHFHEKFSPDGSISKEEWKKEREEKILAPESIDLNFENLQIIAMDRTLAIVQFTLHYTNSSDYTDVTRKKFLLEFIEGRFLIKAEKNLSVIVIQ